MQKNIEKIIYIEDREILIGLSDEGNIFKFYFPSSNNIEAFNFLNNEKFKKKLIEKIKDIDEYNNEYEEYNCYPIKLNNEEIKFSKMFLIKSFLILFDKNDDLSYINLADLKTYLYDEEGINEILLKSNLIINDEYRKKHKKSLNELSNNDTFDIIIDESLKNEDFNFNLKDMKLNNQNQNQSVYLKEIINDNKIEKYLIENNKSYATNFMDIRLKIKRNYKKIVKIDSSEMNILFSDIENKVIYNKKYK
jgi:hypothetical protein